MEIVGCEEGIYIDENEIEGFKDVSAFLLKKYQPSKTIKDCVKNRNSLDQQPYEKLFISLIV